ncbi:glycosyltransferase family 2 protein [Aestuariivirga sp.]|uniref:glycosyltransferase family 2 protein n=1 Tax=Aestuariivirga sp. TaxID=2650926 RepID=UPI0039E563D7
MSADDGHLLFGFAENALYDGKIAGLHGNVLPRVSQAELADALRRLPREEVDQALEDKLVPIITMPGVKLYAACGAQALHLAEQRGARIAASASLEDFHEAVRFIHGKALEKGASLGLARMRPEFSASRRLTSAQIGVGLVLASAVVLGMLTLPFDAAWAAASLIAALFFLAVVALRILCLLPPLRHARATPVTLADADLPVYSVLVPLFRETRVVRQLLNALTALDYPPERLDIKLILEEGDLPMRRLFARLELPPQFEVIIVPAGTLQTKPRALNYALRFARGELLTIYDAEDTPEARQPRLAANAFAGLPQDVACLQAKLVFFNKDENWLTKQFTIEYATLFGLLLPALANHHLPLPLGGTSNHFRAGLLRKVGAWDPYNVTEDADLGLRLSRAGYRTGVLDSKTDEEANVRLGNWMRQRARWLKGFLITWLVHMRDPARVWGELGASGFWAMQALTLGVFASALLHPLCMAASLAMLVIHPVLPEEAGWFARGLAGLNLAVFATGYGVTLLAGRRALRRQRIFCWVLPLLTMPVYWLLMSAAAWLALWQFIRAPFHWNKTEHGLSSFQKRRRGKA